MKKRTLKIGPVETENQVVLAPMAGVCNPAFRLIAKEFGCGLVCAEMVSDKAILHGNERTQKMLYVDEREKPLSLQIFGGDKDSLVEAAKVVDKQTNADIIDINMGCPVPKIIKCDAGARWLLDPNKIEEMVSAVVKAVDKPVTVKMRMGWDDQHIYAVENAQALERAGAPGGFPPWPYPPADVYRRSQLGYYPPGKRSRPDSGDWKRRYSNPPGCPADAG